MPPAMALLIPPPPPSSSLPPSVSWVVEVWIVVHAYYELLRHCHIHSVCCNSVMIPSVHMTHIASVHPGRGILLCCSPEGFFPFFFRHFLFLLFFGEFLLTRCEVLGQGWRMCTDCKALWGKFVICDIELHEINWITNLHKAHKKTLERRSTFQKVWVTSGFISFFFLACHCVHVALGSGAGRFPCSWWGDGWEPT